jgi:hypothetical protein
MKLALSSVRFRPLTQAKYWGTVATDCILSFLSDLVMLMSIFIFKLVVLLNLVSNFIENIFFLSCLFYLLTGRSKRSPRIWESINTGAVWFCFYRRNQKVSNHSLPVLQWTQSPLESGLFLVTKRRETKISLTLANDNKHEIKASQKRH